MPTLVIKNPDGSEQEQDVAQQLTIGRAEGNDLILSEGGVSRKHARFFLEGENFMVEDTGSANGTYVDGEKIAGPTVLSNKSHVVIGDYEIQLKLGSKSLPKTAKNGAKPSKEPTTARGTPVKAANAPRSTRVVQAMKPGADKGAALAKRPGPGKATGPQLRGLTGGITGKTFPLTGTMTVGRVAGVDLQIDDDSVSRRHAEVVVKGKEVVVKDLGSANGTTVNGAPITEETPLSSGDIIQFGVVEVMFETAGGAGAGASRSPISRPSREPAGRPGRPSRSPLPSDSMDGMTGPTEESSGVPMDPRRKRLIIIAGSVLGVLFLLVMIKAFTAPPPPINNDPKPLGGGNKRGPKQPVEDKDPAEQIEELLAECRTFSSSEAGEPDWGRAQNACNKVLELEPIHGEANTLLKRIQVLKVCQDNFNQAKEFVAGGKLEEAVESYVKIGKDCEQYLLRSLSAAKESVAEVKKRAGADCKAYASNSKWDLAYKRCELYSRLACQTLEPKDLYPPALMKMKLEGPLNPKNEWRPADPLYINFLKAREKLKPGEPMWQCPEIAAFRPPPPPPDPGKQAKEELAKRYPEPEMGRALILYFEGKFADAPVPLQKITESMNKSQYHEAARALLSDINIAINLYENGSSEITNDRPEKAEAPFLKAMAIDEKLVLGDKAATMSADDKKREMDKRISFVRRNIIDVMSKTCYDKGKALADRKDFRAACRYWKLGSTFSRANLDLLKALTNVCTKKAGSTLESAQTCEQLKAALDFAVDGDGFKDKVQAAMEEMGCE
ncbi:MAG: FHA domain-containing protein [Myxococcaceae bacterium]